MSADTITRHFNIYVDQGQAQEAYDQLIRKQEALTARIDKYVQEGKAIPANLTKNLNTVTDALDRQSKKISGQLSPSFRDLSSSVNKLSNELRRMSKEDAGFEAKRQQYIQAKAALDNYGGSLSLVKTKFSEMLQTAKGVAFGVLVGNGVQGAVQGILGYAQGLLQFRNEFEGSVRNLSAITGATGSDLTFLKDAAIELSNSGSRSASDFVEAMKLIGSAKPELLSNKEALVEVTKAANLLAKASGLDLPDASKRLTDAMNQFNLPADKAGEVVDRLAAAAKYGAAEVPQVTDALLEFGTQANTSNVSIGESAALIELLAEKGIKGAEAGTKLRNVLLALNAADALDAKAVGDLEKAGVNMNVLKDTSLSLETRLQELGKIANDSTALVHVFGKENYNAAQIVLQNVGRYADLNEQIKENGVASMQASTNTATLANAWGKLMNNISNAFLGIDTSGLAKKITTLTTALFGTGESATAAYQKTKTAFHNMETDIAPLLDRYDALKKKTTLSKDEQAELNTIIQRVGSTIPTAISAFDKYGKAMDINTGKAREFIREQQVLMQFQNKAAITEQEQHLQALTRDYNTYFATLKKGGETVRTEAQLSQGMPGTFVKLTGAEVASLQDKVRGLMQRIEDTKLLIKSLKGETLEDKLTATNTDTGGDTGGDGGDTGGTNPAAEKNKKAIADALKAAEELTERTMKKVQATIDEVLADAEAGYKFQQAGLHQIWEEQKLALKQRLADGKISQEQYQMALLESEVQYYEARAAMAQQHAATSKQAEEDAVRFANEAANKKLDLQIAQNEQQKKLLDQGTEAEKAAAKERLEAWKAKNEQEMEMQRMVAQYGMNIGDSLMRYEANNAQKKLRIYEDAIKMEKLKLKQLHQSKLISENEYNVRMSKLDHDLDQKKKELALKQFKREQGFAIAKIWINAGLASMQAWTEWGWPMALVPQALIIAAAAAETASVSSQEPPSYGAGGEITGPSHADGGVPILAEGDEYVVNKRSTRQFKPLLKMINEAPAQLSQLMSRSSMSSSAPAATGSGGTGGSSAPMATGSGGSMDSSAILHELRELKAEMRKRNKERVLFVQEDYDRFNERLQIVENDQL